MTEKKPMTSGYSTEQIQRMLPKVGDELFLLPAHHSDGDEPGRLVGARRCRVIYVNKKHLFYRVRFASGITQSYKLP